MHHTEDWTYRGLKCAAFYLNEDNYILAVYTPHDLPCTVRTKCKDFEQAKEKTIQFADGIADILDPINY